MLGEWRCSLGYDRSHRQQMSTIEDYQTDPQLSNACALNIDVCMLDVYILRRDVRVVNTAHHRETAAPRAKNSGSESTYVVCPLCSG